MDKVATRDYIQENICLQRGDENIPNNAFGEISFLPVGVQGSTSPYVKISEANVGTAAEQENGGLDKIWELLQNYWKLPEPKLIISVTGGAQKDDNNKELQKSFKDGLMEAARSSDAWIVTGGMKSGIMELVGDAAKSYKERNDKDNRQNIVVLGISTWDMIRNKIMLEDNEGEGRFPCNYSGDQSTPDVETDDSGNPLPELDPNHSHFIFVDSQEKKYGGEINFRLKLEEFVAHQQAGFRVPVVLLVWDGGENTLKTASEAVCNGMPVVVIDGSGRAADFIASAFKKEVTRTKKKKVPTATLR